MKNIKNNQLTTRISCTGLDAHWDFIISSNLTSKNVDEITNALIPFR